MPSLDPEFLALPCRELAAVALDVVRGELVDEGRLLVVRFSNNNDIAFLQPDPQSGKILGASILGAQAGELIQVWVLAIGQGLNIKALAGMIAPYPTLGEASKRAAGSFFAPKLFGERTKRLVRVLARLG